MKTTCVAMLLLAIVSMAGAQTENTDTNSPATFEHAELSALQVVTEFLRALQDHDAKKAKSLLHPELVWDQPGNNRFSGIWKAVPEVSRMFGGMFELTAKTIKLASISVLAVNGNSVACLLHWAAAQPVGRVLKVDNIDVYTIEDGRIVNVKIYSADPVHEDNFWGK